MYGEPTAKTLSSNSTRNFLYSEHMGFIVKNPSKQSVSLKNGLEGKKLKFNVNNFTFKRV
jgi:hypothetical protein